MARINDTTVLLNGSPVAVAEIDIALVPSGGSQCEIVLRDQSTVSLAADEWAVHLDVTASGPTTGAPSGSDIFVGIPQGSKHALARDGNRGIGKSTSIVLLDRFAHFRDLAPPPYSPVTHRSTDLGAELDYVARQVGCLRAVTNIDPILIGRIDYTIDSGYWGALAPWLTPYEPQVFIDPARLTELRALDPSDLDSGMVTPGRAITMADFSRVDIDAVRGDRIDVVRLSYTPTFGVQGTGPSSDDIPDTEITPSSDRNQTGEEVVTTTITGFLHEDPLDPSKRTRPIPLGVITEKFRPARDQDGNLILGDRRVSKEETRNHYEDDYRRLVRVVTTLSALMDRPVVGRIYTESMETRTREISYDADPYDITRVIRTKEVETTEGYALLGAKVPAKIATWNGSVDTTTTSADEVAPRVLQKTTDVYEPITADMHIVHHSVWDELKQVVIESSDRPVTGRSSISLDQQPIIEWIPPNPAAPIRRSLAIDASAIGPDQGRRLASRKVAQSAQPARDVTLAMRIARPERWRLGYVYPLTDLPYGHSGLYLCVAVNYDFKGPRVAQSLRLIRRW